MEPDELIIKKAAAGDHNAFRMIVEANQSLVLAICMNITGSKPEAQNLAQETFLQVYRSLNKYQSKGFKTWIGRIAANKALDWKRSRKAEFSLRIVSFDDSLESFADSKDSPQENLLKKEERLRIIALCRELPSKYSIVLNKYYLLSKSCRQISVEEGISIKTVESRLYRAKKLLKKKWEEDEPDEVL